jgi:hypothetical protein
VATYKGSERIYILWAGVHLQGEVVGEVRQRWHPWRRNYDLYLGRRQFAAISGGFLAWEFELKDAQNNTLALIDRCVRDSTDRQVQLCVWWQ